MHSAGFLLITLLVTGVALAESDDEPFTIEHYEVLTKDMTYDEVVEVMGAEGTEEEPFSEEHPDHIPFIWANPNGSHITVIFKDDALIGMAWGGLTVEPD